MYMYKYVYLVQRTDRVRLQTQRQHYKYTLQIYVLYIQYDCSVCRNHTVRVLLVSQTTQLTIKNKD
jgi:CYTH domain-containing protein